MSFGKLGAMGRGFGHLRALVRAGAIKVWPSAANRPTWDGSSTLSWVGPSGGGGSGADVQQSRTLSTVAGINSSADGQVIEGLNILGPVRIRHNNVTLRQCRIYAAEAAVVQVDVAGKTGVVVEDCLIDGTTVPGANGWWPESGGGSIIRRCNIQGCENAILIAENAMQIKDCWIHDLYDGGNAHTDGIQGTGGYNACTITGNAIYSLDTSCIIMSNNVAFSGLVVDNNLLIMSTGSACFLLLNDKGVGDIGQITFTNNYLGKPGNPGATYNDIRLSGSTGPLIYTGNVDYLTGATVTSVQ